MQNSQNTLPSIFIASLIESIILNLINNYKNAMKHKLYKIKEILLILVAGIFFQNQVQSTNLVEILPVTNKIIMLKFVDGVITYHALEQEREADIVTLYPGGRLPQNIASLISKYKITSTNDPNYATFKNPLTVGVNIRSEQSGAIEEFTPPSYVQTIYVYLFLANPLKSNKTYKVEAIASEVNPNKKSLTFNFKTKAIRSEAVHVNNLGYVPSAENKFGYVYLWMGDKGGLDLNSPNQIVQLNGVNRKARIIRTSDAQQVFVCDVVFRKSKLDSEFGQYGTPNNNFSGADVYECDFSAFNTPGNYVLSVDGIGSSFPFEIGDNIYKEPFYWTMKAIYENRSGIALNTPFAQYDRPAPHRPGVTPGYKLFYTSVRHYDLQGADADAADVPLIDANIKGQVNNWGWYQDAGDWDAYFRHNQIPAHLMFLFESNPEKFASLNLNIEGESNNNLPDVLDEARWLLRFYKRSKDSIKNPTLGGTGGVPGGRIYGDLYPTSDGSNPEGVNAASWLDNDRKWVMTGEDVWMTYFYAGLAAHFSAILKINNYQDPEGINWKKEAVDAWTWAKNNQTAADEVVKWDYNLGLCRMYAASSLYRLTGDKVKYESVFLSDIETTQGEFDYGNNVDTYGFPSGFAYTNSDDNRIFPFGMYKLACNVRPNADAATKTRVESILSASMETILSDYWVDFKACRWGGNFFQPMGIGQSTTPIIKLGHVGHSLLKNSDPTASVWLKNMYNTADYFLGNNPLNTTYISGLGEKTIEQFFHIDSWTAPGASQGPIPKKGIIPYGSLVNCFQDLGACFGFQAPYQYYYGLRFGKAYPMGDDDIFSGSTEPSRPGHERFMPSRTSPLANEFTVNQSNLAGIVTYGYLWAQTANDFTLVNNTQGEIVESARFASENESIIELSIYPNPVNGNEFILSTPYDEGTTSTITIVDVNGKIVFEKNTTIQGNLKVELDNTISVGIYNVVVNSNGAIKTLRFVKN
jgi:endoglucanase